MFLTGVFEGLVEQSTADLCFFKLNRAKLSRAVFLKTQPSKAWYLLCSLAQSSWLFEVTAIF